MHLPAFAFRRLASVRSLLVVPLLGLGALAMGCTPSIGDKCSLSTDCSIRGDRQCDVAQPGGYCTVLNCGRDSCPEEAASVLFQAAIPGCGYDDRSVARTARSFCMAKCEQDSDCRDGYVCRSPREEPWSAVIMDTGSENQQKHVCIPPKRESSDAVGASQDKPEAAVCSRANPVSDAGVKRPDASLPVAPDSGAEAGVDGGDAGVDAGDASAEGGVDGGADGGDAGGVDGGDAGVTDSGVADADDDGG